MFNLSVSGDWASYWNAFLLPQSKRRLCSHRLLSFCNILGDGTGQPPPPWWDRSTTNRPNPSWDYGFYWNAFLLPPKTNLREDTLLLMFVCSLTSKHASHVTYQGKKDLHPWKREFCFGGVCIKGGARAWDTTWYGQPAVGTHPTGMLSCFWTAFKHYEITTTNRLSFVWC